MPTPQEQFIANIYPGAKKISDETGSSVEIILAQTALETGWGQKILPGTNNLYNIKADASWKGKSAEFTVPEEDKKTGKVYMSKEKFRVYDSYAESMADRAKFLAENHRYEKAGLYKPEVKGNLEKEAQAIANAGYATDSNYAEKLVKVGNGRSVRGGIDLAEGRSSQLHNGDHDGVLRRGDRGDAVGALQASLTALGYKDSNGHQLQADQDFGANTYHAVKAFQHDHGLLEDGIAGRATLGAITEAVARQKIPSMMDTGHPAKGMYDQAFQCVAQLDKNHHRETGPHSQMLSGSLVTAATAAGFQRIDHVILSDDASRAYAVQGDLKSPFKQYADVDVMKAIQTPLSQSSEEAVVNIRANEHAEIQKSQQQPAQQQTSDIQQQSTILQR